MLDKPDSRQHDVVDFCFCCTKNDFKLSSYICENGADFFCCLHLRRFECLSTQEVDPCDDLNDDDIRTAIQNATGPKNVLFVPEV